MFTVAQNENLPKMGIAFDDLELAMAYAQESCIPVVVAMGDVIIAHIAPAPIRSVNDQGLEWIQDVLEDLHIMDVDVRLTKLHKIDAWHSQKNGRHSLRIRVSEGCFPYRHENGYWDYEDVFNRVTKHLGYRPFGMTAVRLIGLHEIAHIVMQITYQKPQDHNSVWMDKFIELIDMYLRWEGR